MRTLPPITDPAAVPVLELRQRFGTEPVVTVYPADRYLSAYHAAAVTNRGWPMTRAVARIMGGFFLRGMAELVTDENREREIDRVERQEWNAAVRDRRGAQDDDEGSLGGGMTVAGIPF